MDEMVDELCERLRTQQRLLLELQSMGQQLDSARFEQALMRVRQCEGWLSALGAEARLEDLRNGNVAPQRSRTNAA